MDTTTNDRQIVKQTIRKYAQFRPSHGQIRLDTVFDDSQDRYLLMQGPVGIESGESVVILFISRYIMARFILNMMALNTVFMMTWLAKAFQKNALC